MSAATSLAAALRNEARTAGPYERAALLQHARHLERKFPALRSVPTHKGN